MASVLYWGLFLDGASVDLLDEVFGGDSLEFLTDDPHVTFQFKPRSFDRSLLGKSLSCRVTGYGNDGRNQGVSVDLGEFRSLCQNETPHVTLSLAPGARAKDTGNLTFSPVEEALVLTGTVCACLSDGTFDEGA